MALKTTIKRSELYEKVWQMPITRIAKEFDISDVGLAKACRSHNVPTPRPGYWTQLEHGKAPPQTPLPAGEDVVITLEPSRHRLPQPTFEPTAVAQAGLVAAVLSASDDFPSKLATLSSTTYQALKAYKTNESGFIHSKSRTAFTCEISPATRDRAVRLLDAVERTVLNIGGQWKASKDSNVLVLEFDGETMGFSLTEQYKRTERKDEKHTWYSLRKFDYHFSGELTLTLDGDYKGRKTWSDGKRSQLEGKLSEFAAGVQNAAKALKELREEQEAREKRWAEEAKVRQEAETKARHFNHFKASLLAEANAWHDFQRASEYVTHLEAQLSGLPANSQMQAWMAMAKECALSFDPTSRRIELLQSSVAPKGLESYYGPFGQQITSSKT